MTIDNDQPADEKEPEDRPPPPPPPQEQPPARAPQWVPDVDKDADRPLGDLAGDPDTDY